MNQLRGPVWYIIEWSCDCSLIVSVSAVPVVQFIRLFVISVSRKSSLLHDIALTREKLIECLWRQKVLIIIPLELVYQADCAYMKVMMIVQSIRWATSSSSFLWMGRLDWQSIVNYLLIKIYSFNLPSNQVQLFWTSCQFLSRAFDFICPSVWFGFVHLPEFYSIPGETFL